jgi:hypothetical protein
VIGTDRWRSEPPCVCQVARRATWPNGEWGYSTRRHMLEPLRPEAVLPDRALCLPTFSHFLIVNKTSLSLPPSLSLPLLFSLGWQVTRVPPYERRPFPSKENRHIPERYDLGPPVVPGGQEITLGS